MSDRAKVSERDREIMREQGRFQRLSKTMAAAEDLARMWADTTPRQVHQVCPTCGCRNIYVVLPPDEPRHEIGDPLPIIEGVSRECINCILHPDPHPSPG